MMKNTEPFISIIMPVFNSESVVGCAIESIINQSLQEWELLIVDDCSSDRTCEVIDEYVKRDCRISLYRKKKNEGPGKAKNLGLQMAKGKYVTFVDSDDWIDGNAYYDMSFDKTITYDVVIAGFYRDIYGEDDKVIERSVVSMIPAEILSKRKILQIIPEIDEKRLFSYACNKLYKKDIIDTYHISFTDKKFGEDYDFNIEYFNYVETIRILENSYYHYIKNNMESLTEKYIPDFFEINKDRFTKMETLLKNNQSYTLEAQQIVMSSYIRHFLAAIARLYDQRGNLSSKDRRSIVKKMFKDQMSEEAMKYSKGKRIKDVVCNTVFKSGNITLNLMFGKVLWFMQNKGKKIYERMK